jgi:hypothetical protein
MRPANKSHGDSTQLLTAEEMASLLKALHRDLTIRQSIRGGWGFNARQDALEPTCLAILTLRHQSGAHVEKALNRIARLQHEDGSWPAFDGAGREGAWTTALALLALLSVGRKGGSLQRAIGWLLSQRGREADWFWRWKFRTVDTNVRFDPAKYGWNWIPGTISWVIPTSFSLIALRRARDLCGTAKLDQRLELGAEMLLDRMCPGGGWNAGNGMAFGIPYVPYIDTTAIALLALRGYESGLGIQRSLSWLVNRLPSCPSPYSLAWGILALAAYQHINTVQDALGQSAASLTGLIERRPPTDVCTVAVCALALDAVEGDNVFEV